MEVQAPVHCCVYKTVSNMVAAVMVAALGGCSLRALILSRLLYLATYHCYKIVTPDLEFYTNTVNSTS